MLSSFFTCGLVQKALICLAARLTIGIILRVVHYWLPQMSSGIDGGGRKIANTYSSSMLKLQYRYYSVI